MASKPPLCILPEHPLGGSIVAVVGEEAIEHIRRYGSHHTEAILSSNEKSCEFFRKNIDASMIAINTSTRFNDGGELGLGAEIGISTSKFHAYGAMGAREMTAIRHVLKGSGQIRS